MSRSKIVGAVEIGTSKVVVLVGEIIDGRTLNIIGMGECSSSGVCKGEVVDMKAASNCTHAALMAAEKTAKAEIEEVYLAETGGHLEGFFNTGAANVSSSDGIVGPDDVRRACEDGKSRGLPPHRLYVHHIRNHFLLDGRMVKNPVGMQGSKLESAYWSVHADEAKLRDRVYVINGQMGLEVKDVIISSIASGTIIATDEEKQAGVLTVDIGSGTTDWALFKNGVVQRTGVVPVGGDHFTNDLALGLRIGVKHADQIKLQFGKAVLEKDDRMEKVWMVGDQTIGDRHLPLQSIILILSARVDELFAIIKKQLGDLCNPTHIPAGVVLTGGSSQLRCMTQAATKTMGLDARLGVLPDWVNEQLQAPGYCTALGLMTYALTGQSDEADQTARKSEGILKKFTKLFSF